MPPPGGGVLTVSCRLPGRRRSDAGRSTVSCVELTYVAGMFAPLIATVEPAVKPVP